MENTSKPYPHDFLIDRLILWAIPSWIKPNHFTVLRFFLVAPVVWLIYSHDYLWGGILFVATAFTDAIDGSLARTRNQVTEWGELFDPLADKLLIGAVGFILIFRLLHWVLIVIILVLEFLTIVAAFYVKWRQMPIRPRANVFGKIKMVLQSTGVILLLVFTQMPNNNPLGWVISGIFIVSIFFTVLSIYFAGI